MAVVEGSSSLAGVLVCVMAVPVIGGWTSGVSTSFVDAWAGVSVGGVGTIDTGGCVG